MMLVVLYTAGFSQSGGELRGVSAFELETSRVIPSSTVHVTVTEENQKVLACPTLQPNDNFANATNLTVNGGTVSGTTCGSLETGETTACNASAGSQSVWYKFTATAATQYVQISYLTGACYFGSAVYSTTTLPTSACGDRPISCQSASYGPLVDLYELTNLTVGQVYHIQIIYTTGSGCGTNGSFAIQVTSASPGGTITNPPYTNQCSTVAPGCYFTSPPAANTVTTVCTGYPLAANGYGANSVFTLYQIFTNSPTSSNVSFQAIITSNCGAGGNVVWLNWALYSPGCGLIGCGDINTLTINGLACSGTYILMYQFELSNCTNFTTVWPYQNAPAAATPCTALPVELLYFTAKYQDDNTVKLEWETATENNAKRFVIEKSTNGLDFTPIKDNDAMGKNGMGSKYVFTDDSRITDGTYYYKLRELDNDGQEKFSKTLAITIDGQKGLLCCSPDPASDQFDVMFSSKLFDQDTRLEIYNLSGQKMMDEMFRPTTTLKTIDISALPAGLYFVNITSPGASKVIRQKLIKQ